MERMIEVRCCCQPRKLLGWLPYDGELQRGKVVSFVAAPELHVRDVLNAAEEILSDARYSSQVVSLPLEEFRHYFPREGDHYKGIAFKSEETPTTVLRRIRGFVPNEHEE
jgi:hypothetical protein